mgnify:CR=1 FL=1
MKSFRFFLYGVAISFCIISYPVQARFDCFKTQDLVMASMQDGYAFMAVAIIDNILPVIVMLDQEGNFKVIGTDPDEKACLLIQGSEWTFAMDSVV